MSSKNDSIVEGLMRELAHEEQVLIHADQALHEARIRFEVATEKYAAVRDVVARHLGRNPGRELVKDEQGVSRMLNGRYRFIHMSPGDAAIAVLRESDEPMALNEIANAMMKGGLRFPDMMRTVNAALMKTGGVKKTEKGTYRYIEPKAEELPFE
jgi:hypothetical protein